MNSPEYQSPWEPIYRDYVKMRLAWESSESSNNIKGPGFYLALLMNELLTSNGSLTDQISKHRKICDQRGDTEARTAIDEVAARWRQPLDRLNTALKQPQPADGIFEDAYHCALDLCLGKWSAWYPSVAWWSEDGLTPKLPLNNSIDISMVELLNRQSAITESAPWMNPNSDQHRNLPPDNWIADPVTLSKRTFRFFRGQRKGNHIWPIKSRLDRWCGGDRNTAATKVAKLAAGLERQGGISFDLACAVIQHYGSELDAYTHLMDVTAEPLVALWFASSGDLPKEGEIDDRVGVIMKWSLDEFVNLGANRSKAIGNIRILSPGSEPRICHQRGIFLASPHPLFINQTLPLCLKFHQRVGLKFEDIDRNISDEYLLNVPSPWFGTLKRSHQFPEPTPDQVVKVTGERLSDVDECFTHLKSNFSDIWSDTKSVSIEKLARFHVRLSENPDCPERVKSLRLLNATAQKLLISEKFLESDIPYHYHCEGRDAPITMKCWVEVNL